MALFQIAQSVESGEINDDKMIAQLSEALIRHKHSDSAIGLLERLVESDPENRRLRLRLADVLHDLNRFHQADKHYQHLLASASKVTNNSRNARLSQSSAGGTTR